MYDSACSLKVVPPVANSPTQDSKVWSADQQLVTDAESPPQVRLKKNLHFNIRWGFLNILHFEMYRGIILKAHWMKIDFADGVEKD